MANPGSRMEKEEKYVITGLTLFFGVFCLIALLKDGTGDQADSISHYFISRYAFKHPYLFIHHWGKPVFVLLSTPFAQLGFKGIKLFNCFIACLTAFFTYRTAKLFRIQMSWLSVLLLFFSPMYFTLIFSGLTEYLFAFVLILSVFLMIDGRTKFSSILVSFIPFVRTEGLIIIGIFAIYLIAKKKFRVIPLLLTGHILYSISGYFYYHDFLWVFREIPYLNIGSPYGMGHVWDFFNKLYYVIGFPVYLVLALGIIYILITFLKPSLKFNKEDYFAELILIYGSFGAYFLAHSLFWGLGIFNSMGLGRVMIAVMPAIVLIGLRGIQLVSGFRFAWLNLLVKVSMITYLLVFPFTGNPAAVKWKTDFDLTPGQKLIREMIGQIKNGNETTKIYSSHPYIPMVWGIDPFDTQEFERLSKFNGQNVDHKPALIFWDNWYSMIEDHITQESLAKIPGLKLIGVYETSAMQVTHVEVFKFNANGDQ
jgi:hypothetical protein